MKRGEVKRQGDKEAATKIKEIELPSA